MPNHYLVIGLCARDWGRLNEEEIEEYDDIELEKINGINLCETVLPMPKELSKIVMAEKPSKYINKKTGDIWDYEDGEHPKNYNEWDLTELTINESLELQKKFGSDNWYDWGVKNWGVKWGTYNTKVQRMNGDGGPVLISFESAWYHPNENVLKLINDYLKLEFCLGNITWVGHDPMDNSTKIILQPDTI